ERLIVPDDAGMLVGFRVVVALLDSGFAADHAVENGANQILGVLADLMAGTALVEYRLAVLHVRSRRYGRQSPHQNRPQDKSAHDAPNSPVAPSLAGHAPPCDRASAHASGASHRRHDGLSTGALPAPLASSGAGLRGRR